MPLPVILDHFRVIASFSNIPSGRPFSISADYAGIAGPPVGDEEVAFAFGAALVDTFQAILQSTAQVQDFIHPDVVCQNITCYDLSGDKAPFETGLNPGIAGDSTFDALPPDLAIVVSKRTGTRGRRGRGRFYMGGWTENMNTADGNIFQAGPLQTIVNDNLLTLQNSSDEDIATMVVISQVAVPTGTPFDVTNLLVDNHWDVQRRRGQA